MITFNGIELDVYENSLKPPILKRSLSSLQNLEDRKGTVSTEFNIPRTSKNELAFNNATVAGSQTQAVGDGVIYIDGNVYQQGKIYLRSFNDGDISAVFIGGDLDLMSILKTIPLSELFSYDFTTAYTNGNFKNYIETIQTITDNGRQYQSHINHPTSLFTDNDTEAFKIQNWSFFFRAKDIVKNIIEKQGYNYESTFFANSDLNLLDYSYFNGHKATDIFASNMITPSNNSDTFNLGTASVSNTQTTFSTDKYELTRDCENINVKMNIELNNPDEVERVEIIVFVKRPDGGILGDKILATNLSFDSGGGLQEGINYFNFQTEGTFLIDDYIQFEYRIVPKGGFTAPYTGLDFVLSQAIIQTDVLEENDRIWFGNYMDDISQFEFLKGILNDLNLVMLINGNNVNIELKDNSFSPINLTALDGVETSTIDISDKIEAKTDVEFLDTNNRGVHLIQNVIDSKQAQEVKTLEFQAFGSYFYAFNNSANQQDVSSISSFFNTIYNYVDLILGVNVAAVQGLELEYKSTWSKLLVYRYGWNDIINQQFSRTTLIDFDGSSIASLDMFILQGRFTRFSYTWDKLFINTLKKKAQNFTRTVRLYDHLGTLISFRNKYVIDGQIYSLQSYDYNLETKLVTAKLLLENG